ncbi:VIR protein [Plasmodium vivax]|uniref:VIR protein n=1 Tax=Plasmodium vivax TaxID=5855 RepID=A0A1G4HIB2_PLAVI|nr:VIR protein [Plasmodium vivax]
MSNCYEEFRNGLKSYAKYELFNKPVEVEVEKLKCEELAGKLPMYKGFKKFCYMLSKNIKSVCKSLEYNQSSQENCELLNYWLYDALIKIKFLNDEKNITESPLIEKISELWNASNCNNNCGLNKYSISTKDFKNLKELFDYSKHYLAIEYNKQHHEEEQCRKQYCSYLKKVENIYNIVKPLCTAQNDKPYCEILRKIPENKIPSVFLQSYECTDDEINDDFIKYEEIFTKPLLAAAFEDTDNPSVEQQTGDLFPQLTIGQRQYSPEEPTQYTLEGTSSISPVKVGLSLTGISFFPLLLIYKFTPAGNLLRRVINKKLEANYNTGEIPSGDWFSISRAHQNDIQSNREFNVLYQNMEKK